MALQYVTLILDGFDGGGTQLTRGTATFTPSVQLTDPTDQEWIPPAPVSAEWRKGLAAPQVSLLATDNANVLPAGWGWKVSFLNVPGSPGPFSFFLPFTGGATQRLSQLQPVQSVTTMQACMPLPTGTPVAGDVPVATGNGEASAWTAPAQPWVTLPGNWYTGPWFTAKAANFATPAWILFDGDSVTNGVNPANLGYLATGWPDRLRASLLASTGAAVYGDFYAIWGYTFGAGAVDPVNEGFATPLTGSTQYEGGFGSCLTNGSNNTWFQILTTGSIPGWTGGNVTGFDLVYYDFGACTWGFTIDGGQGGSPVVSGATWNGSMWVVTNTGGSFASGNVKKVTVRGVASGSHVIEYGQVSSAGNVMWIGLSLFTGNTGGIGFVRSAYSGRRAVDAACAAGSNAGYAGTLSTFPNDKIALWSGSGPTNATAQITPAPFGFPTQPALAFIGFGINDAACFIAPGAYGDAIERRIVALRRGTPNANIALIAMSYPDVHNSDNNLPGDGQRYVRYKRVLAELAAAYNCAYVDIDSKWGGTPVAQGFMQSGNVHPTAAGHADIAAAIAGII